MVCDIQVPAFKFANPDVEQPVWFKFIRRSKDSTPKVCSRLSRSNRYLKDYAAAQSLMRTGFQRGVVLLVVVALLRLFYLRSVHLRHVQELSASPFDNAKAVMIYPLYWLSCPKRRIEDQTCKIDRVIMLSARPKSRTARTRSSWRAFPLDVVDTLPLSYAQRSGGVCPEMKWQNVLFGVYQMVMRESLERHPNQQYFLFAEDDAFLEDSWLLKKDYCMAKRLGLRFYSFFKPKAQQDSCIYQHGTVAFMISRDFMEEIISVDTSISCRLPIDMYIVSRGPWYATVSSVVKHTSARFRLPPQKAKH